MKSPTAYSVQQKDIIQAIVFFAASALITWWFIVQAHLIYFSEGKMIASCGIAGAKWGIQIAAAFILLKEKKWSFIKSIGFVCLVGSCILLPYCLCSFIRNFSNSFLISIILAVLIMIFLYYKSVQKMGISKAWFWGWIVCLSIAVSLQIFVVF